MRRNGVWIAAAVLVVVGLLGWWTAHGITSAEGAQNKAVVDATATATVQAEVSRALSQVLSYDHASPGTTEAAADEVLAGAARKEYDTLFATLEKKAPGQKLVLTAQVQSVGVKELTADTAKLLVFLDQSSQRATDSEASLSAAQLAVGAKKVNGSWKITSLKPL